jgi:hypothetical protein
MFQHARCVMLCVCLQKVFVFWTFCFADSLLIPALTRTPAPSYTTEHTRTNLHKHTAGMADTTTSASRLYGLAAWLSAVSFARQLSLHTGATFQWTNGMELRASAVAVLFRKVLRLRAETLSTIKTGHLITLMTNDVERFVHTWAAHSMWIAPALLTAVLIIGWSKIGAAILAGAGVMVGLLPLQMFMGRQFATIRQVESSCAATDSSVSKISLLRLRLRLRFYCESLVSHVLLKVLI